MADMLRVIAMMHNRGALSTLWDGAAQQWAEHLQPNDPMLERTVDTDAYIDPDDILKTTASQHVLPRARHLMWWMWAGPGVVCAKLGKTAGDVTALALGYECTVPSLTA